MISSAKRKADPASSPEGPTSKVPKTSSSITSFFKGPTTLSSSHTSAGCAASSSQSSSPSTSFDKQSWIDSLTPEKRSLLQLEIDTLDPSWLAVLHRDLEMPSFLQLKRFLQSQTASGATIYPKAQDIYAWSRHSPLSSVKVVILAQDPYHGPNQAHGLCFSVLAPAPAPPSLKNVYICLQKDIPAFVKPAKNGGDLTPWADRGVLLLNTCLTVRRGEANSHAGKGWERFTGRVIEEVKKRRTRGVVFMAWGSPAQKNCTGINKTTHLVLTSVHPSPLSASKGFFDCGHFKKANQWLRERYGLEGAIDWSLNYTSAASSKQAFSGGGGGNSSGAVPPPALTATESAEPRGWRKKKPEKTEAQEMQEMMDGMDDEEFEALTSSQPAAAAAAGVVVGEPAADAEKDEGEVEEMDAEKETEAMDQKANALLASVVGGDAGKTEEAAPTTSEVAGKGASDAEAAEGRKVEEAEHERAEEVVEAHGMAEGGEADVATEEEIKAAEDVDAEATTKAGEVSGGAAAEGEVEC